MARGNRFFVTRSVSFDDQLKWQPLRVQAAPMSKETSSVFFDLDGTLVETAPDLIRATNHALAIAGAAPVEPHLIRPMISFGARAMIAEGLKLQRSQRSERELDRLHSHFLDFYAANIAAEPARQAVMPPS